MQAAARIGGAVRKEAERRCELKMPAALLQYFYFTIWMAVCIIRAYGK